jgi:hypothetical protein
MTNKTEPLKKWWAGFKPYFFFFSSALIAGLGFFLDKKPLYWITGYIFTVTIIILAIRHLYPPTQRAVTEVKLAPRKPKSEKKTKYLNFSELLLVEFDYVQETATQAMSDRLTLVNYFLLSAGVVLASAGLMVSAEGGAQFAYRYEVLIVLSLTFNAVGWIYFMQIVRLRQAWCESALAMSHIKTLFVQNSEFLPNTAKDAFLWNSASIPAPGKKMTVFYLSALLIALISAAALGLAATLLLTMETLHASDLNHKYISIPLQYPFMGFLLGLYHMFFQMSMYTALLDEPPGHSSPTPDQAQRASSSAKKI